MELDDFEVKRAKDAWQKELERTQAPSTVKRTLSVDATLRSTMEAILSLLGGKVGPGETSSKLIDAHRETYARALASQADSSLLYDLIPILNDQPVTERVEILLGQMTPIVVSTPDREAVSVADMDRVKEANEVLGYARGYRRLYEAHDDQDRLLARLIAGTGPDAFYCANRTGWVTMAHMGPYRNCTAFEEEFLRLAMRLYLTSKTDLYEALVELEGIAEALEPDVEGEQGYYHLEGREKPFMRSFAEAGDRKVENLIEGLAYNLNLRVEYVHPGQGRFTYAEPDEDVYRVTAKTVDCETRNHWKPDIKLLREKGTFALHREAEMGEWDENFYFSTYQEPMKATWFFSELIGRAMGTEEQDFLQRDAEEAKNDALNGRMEAYTDEFTAEGYRTQGVIYLFVGQGEKRIPAGYVRMRFDAYYRAGAETPMPRHPKAGLAIHNEVESIYLAPEYRGKGGAQFIGKAIALNYGTGVLFDLADFYDRECEEPLPIDLEFEADTISSGGVAVMSHLSDAIDVLVDECKMNFDLPFSRHRVVYS